MTKREKNLVVSQVIVTLMATLLVLVAGQFNAGMSFMAAAFVIQAMRHG